MRLLPATSSRSRVSASGEPMWQERSGWHMSTRADAPDARARLRPALVDVAEQVDVDQHGRPLRARGTYAERLSVLLIPPRVCWWRTRGRRGA